MPGARSRGVQKSPDVASVAKHAISRGQVPSEPDWNILLNIGIIILKAKPGREVPGAVCQPFAGRDVAAMPGSHTSDLTLDPFAWRMLWSARAY